MGELKASRHLAETRGHICLACMICMGMIPQYLGMIPQYFKKRKEERKKKNH